MCKQHVTRCIQYLKQSLGDSIPFIIPMGLLYAIGIPTTYFIYISTENLWLNILCTTIALIVLLCHFNLFFNKKYLVVYWLLFLIINFPLMFIYDLLSNPNVIAYKLAMMIMLLSFFTMITDIALLIGILLVGTIVAYLFFVLHTNHWFIPIHIRNELPAYVLSILFGLILSFNRGRQYKKRLDIMHLFVHQANHELRTPLTKIKWRLQDMIAAIPEDKREALTAAQEINNETIKSTEVMQTLEAVSFALDEQDINYEHISMYDCLEEAITRYHYGDTFNVENVIWQESHDFYFHGSHVLMVQILFNLLNNSIYATKDVQQPRIEINNTSDKKYHYLWFKDNGTGIKKSIQKSIFKPFFTTKKEGKGLGLYFCREIIRKFSGDIQCQSEYGKFTTFIMKFAKNDTT